MSKVKLSELKVASFVTALEEAESRDVKGGDRRTIDLCLTVRTCASFEFAC